MRREKPLPKESSFQEFADNRSKRPKTRTRTKKPRFQIKDDKPKDSGRSSGRRTSSRDNDRRSSRDNDSRDSGRRTSNRTRDSRSLSGDRRSSSPRGRNNDRRDSGRRDSRSGSVKHDRRTSRGKSFKEDRRDSRDRGRSWDSIPKNKRGDERRARGKIEMFDAICKKCNKPCKVPFKPQMSKGVLCSDCFDKNARDNPRFRSGNFKAQYRDAPSGSGQKFARTNAGVKELFDAVCMKCKKPCKVPFKPTGKMGVSCSNCFVKNESPGRGRKTGGRSSFARGRPSVRSRR